MKPVYNRMSGEKVLLPTPEERYKARLARMRHIVWLAVTTIAECREVDGGNLTMYTLTYKDVAGWRPRDVSGCVRWLRAQGARLYVWVGELQKRGAVHYHVLALLPPGAMWIKPSENVGGWFHGFTWVTPDVRFPWYVMKYLQKGEGCEKAPKFPAGFRLYGVSREVVRRMSFENAASYRRAQVPGWLLSDAADLCDIRCAFRFAGGAGVRGQKAFSVYSRTPLPDIDAVEAQMYNSWSS